MRQVCEPLAFRRICRHPGEKLSGMGRGIANNSSGVNPVVLDVSGSHLQQSPLLPATPWDRSHPGRGGTPTSKAPFLEARPTFPENSGGGYRTESVLHAGFLCDSEQLRLFFSPLKNTVYTGAHTGKLPLHRRKTVTQEPSLSCPAQEMCVCTTKGPIATVLIACCQLLFCIGGCAEKSQHLTFEPQSQKEQ